MPVFDNYMFYFNIVNIIAKSHKFIFVMGSQYFYNNQNTYKFLFKALKIELFFS